MGVFRFSLRIPENLHTDAETLVGKRQSRDPGASLNSLICEALADYIARIGPKEVATMTKFHLDPMDRTGLICVDASASPTAPMTPYLELDTRNGKLDISFRHQCDNGVSPAIYHSLVLIWEIPVALDAQQFAADINNGELDALLGRVMAGASSKWDGNNTVGTLTEDAQDARDEVQDWINNEPTLPDGGGLWEAGDWFADGAKGIKGLTATTTDRELQTLADSLEREALGDYVVLADTLHCLRKFREELQES